jgi:integrase/recombinase XerD
MTLQRAVELFKAHQAASVKEKTRNSYIKLLQKFEECFKDRYLESIRPEEVAHFLEDFTTGLAAATRKLRYAQLKAFFNCVIESHRLKFLNPCNTPGLFKAFKSNQRRFRQILDKETVDEIIYNARSSRDRLILELQARCGLRIGEVLKLRVSDISGRKLLIKEPKSGKDVEVAFMPEHIAQRLSSYISEKGLTQDDRIFGICYTTVRNLLRTLASHIGVNIAPHDLRRHSATYASRNGVPLEIISKVILRHQDLKTTQVYLGKVTDS